MSKLGGEHPLAFLSTHPSHEGRIQDLSQGLEAAVALFDEAVRAGFGPLARYIFAKERPGEKIAMTAPVTQKADGPSWTIQFIMPSAYNLDRLPKPSGMDVQLRALPPARRAAIRFSGWWSDELFVADVLS